jgi:hypothetical protein
MQGTSFSFLEALSSILSSHNLSSCICYLAILLTDNSMYLFNVNKLENEQSI